MRTELQKSRHNVVGLGEIGLFFERFLVGWTGCVPTEERCVCLPERRKGNACKTRDFPNRQRRSRGS
jgi:hypothetical protein